jgi:hypothetical protein
MIALIAMKAEGEPRATNHWLVFCNALRLLFMEKRLETCHQFLKTIGQSFWLAVGSEWVFLPTANSLLRLLLATCRKMLQAHHGAVNFSSLNFI